MYLLSCSSPVVLLYSHFVYCYSFNLFVFLLVCLSHFSPLSPFLPPLPVSLSFVFICCSLLFIFSPQLAIDIFVHCRNHLHCWVPWSNYTCLLCFSPFFLILKLYVIKGNIKQIAIKTLISQWVVVYLNIFMPGTKFHRLLRPVEHWRLTVLWIQSVLLDVIWRPMRRVLRKENYFLYLEIL